MRKAPFTAMRQTFTTGGSTLGKNGQSLQLQTGFVVGGFNETVLPETCSISRFVNAWESKATACNGSREFVGTWMNEGSIYFDVVQIYATQEEASNVAIANNEIAIYDLSRKESINIKQ